MNTASLVETLPVVVKGMAGIFVVTIVIMTCIYLLNKISSKKN